jgi:predicted nucleic acid-binding protein
MAYLLDTNVLSELRKKARADSSVMTWFAGVEDREIFLSVLVLGEVRRGIELRRQHDPQAARSLDAWLKGLGRRYAEQILPVSAEVADLWGGLCLRQPLPSIDGLLAATALHHDLTLVTRNVTDVERSGVKVFNPFAVAR